MTHRFMMFVRKDILEATGLPIPNTWNELLVVAAALNGTDMNGDGVPDRSLCLNRKPLCRSVCSLCKLIYFY